MTRQAELFHPARATTATPAHAPLAERMRPRTIDEFVGQEHLLGRGHVLGDMIESGRVESLILWGPPGSGKTTLAHLLAAASGAPAVSFSAVLQGVKELRQIIDEAEVVLERSGQPTVLFVDEIHRFNKAQQDAFLPHVEAGTITLIGATTENPSFEVSAPPAWRARAARTPSTCRFSRRPRSNARSATTRRARSTTTSSRRSSKASAAAIPTPPSTG